MDPLPPQRPGQVSFWRRLSELERQALKRVGTQRSVFAGDTVAVHDEPGITVIMADSWVRLQAGNARTSRSVIDMAAPGDLVSALHSTHPASPEWLGEMADIHGVALRRGTLLDVTGDMIPIVLGDLPHISALIRRIQNDQLHFISQMQAVRRLTMDTRLARLLLNLLHRFGEQSVGGRNVLAPRLSQADLAAWIGVSETSIGRILRQWCGDGLVSTGYSSISIADPKALRGIANSAAMPYARFPTTRKRREPVGSGRAQAGAPPRVAAGVDLVTDLPPGIQVQDRKGRSR